MTGSPTTRLALWSLEHPKRVLLGWFLLILWGAWAAGGLASHLRGEIGGISGSVSDRVMQRLSRDFDFPFAHHLVVCVHGTVPDQLTRTSAHLSEVLSAFPGAAGVRELPSGAPGWRAIAVGLKARTVEEEEALVQPLRALLARETPPGVEALTTGTSALSHDLVQHGSSVTRDCETQILPFLLLTLMLAFGTPGAALMPLLSGAGAVVLAMGMLDLLARVMPLSVYASNVATMLGLGLGIDYSLFLISRRRDELAGGLPDPLLRATAACAPIVTTAAGTVLAGLVVLALLPIDECRGMGIGGAVVALTSWMTSLTLLPALVAVSGSFLDRPRWLAGRVQGATARWERRARWIVSRPVTALLVSIGCLLVLGFPALGLRLGMPEFNLAPRSLESVRGMDAARLMGHSGAMLPIHLMVEVPPRTGGILAPRRLDGLSSISGWLQRQAEVAEVQAVVTPRYLARIALAARMLGARGLQERLPQEARWFVSRDGDSTLIQVIPRHDLTYGEVRAFAGKLRSRPWGDPGALGDARIDVGGPAAIELDFISAARSAMPPMALAITVLTALLLVAQTRSILIPVKAILSNALTVLAAMGLTLAVFGHPVTAAWLGLPASIPSVPAVYPIMLFCLLFGLSMDYEVMLIGRIAEAHEAGLDDRAAVITGLGGSGGIITSAAILMAIVFAGFAATDLVPVKLLGFGLTAGVILDATVTRLFLVPSLMVLIGRWNWWPGKIRAVRDGL